MQLRVIRLPLIVSMAHIVSLGKAFPTLKALFMDGNYSHVTPNFVSCLPSLFESTVFLLTISMETPCTVHVAAALTRHCRHLENISITLDHEADMICKIITQNTTYLCSFRVMLLNTLNIKCELHSNSIQHFSFIRELCSLQLHKLPTFTFPRVETLVFRACYISEKFLYLLCNSCPKLSFLDVRYCVTGPKCVIEGGLKALWTQCKNMRCIQAPPRI